MASNAAALNDDAIAVHTPPRNLAADDNPGGAGLFTSPPSSVHPSLQGSGSLEEGSPGISDGTKPRDAELASSRQLLSEPVLHSSVESLRTMLDFPSLDTTPPPHRAAMDTQQPVEALSLQVTAMLDSARLSGCTAARLHCCGWVYARILILLMPLIMILLIWGLAR